jgi:hypothetical protein
VFLFRVWQGLSKNRKAYSVFANLPYSVLVLLNLEEKKEKIRLTKRDKRIATATVLILYMSSIMLTAMPVQPGITEDSGLVPISCSLDIRALLWLHVFLHPLR